MALTGPLFLVAVVVLTLLAFGGLVVLWPRLSDRSPAHVAGRVAGLLLVNVLVLLTAATQLNAAYLFFAGWGDLTGALTGHVAATGLDRGGAASSATSARVQGPSAGAAIGARSPLPGSVPATGLATYTVHGARSGLTGSVVVQLPPGYGSAAARSRRYPVLEAFPGYPGVPRVWAKVFHIGAVLEHQEREHHLGPTLVVMPQVEIPSGVDTEGVDGSAGDPQVETWLTRDVPDWVAQHLRVRSGRDSWATIGFSAGGWNAAMATMLHPSQYAAAIVLGGYFRPRFGALYRPFGPGSRLARRYDLPRLAARHPPAVAVWLETSHADPLSFPSSEALLRSARAPTAVHAVILRDAGHRDSVWIGQVPTALRWLGSSAAGFRSSGGGSVGDGPQRSGT